MSFVAAKPPFIENAPQSGTVQRGREGRERYVCDASIYTVCDVTMAVCACQCCVPVWCGFCPINVGHHTGPPRIHTRRDHGVEENREREFVRCTHGAQMKTLAGCLWVRSGDAGGKGPP